MCIVCVFLHAALKSNENVNLTNVPWARRYFMFFEKKAKSGGSRNLRHILAGGGGRLK